MNPIINLTQHAASADQIAVGVVDLTGPERETLLNALDFLTMPSSEEIKGRAKVIADLAALSSGQTGSAMIGGAFWLMAPLVEELKARNIQPVFAFSLRESSEIAMPDGSVRKTLVFRHVGWIPAL